MGKGKKIGTGVGIGILVFFISAVIVTMSNNEERQLSSISFEEERELKNKSIEELHENAVSWYYDDLLRNPEKYKGKIIEFDGKIFRVDSLGKDHYAFIVWVGDGLDQLVVDWKGGRLLDGDKIRGYGVFEEVIDMGSMLVDNFYNPKPYVKGIQLTCTNC